MKKAIVVSLAVIGGITVACTAFVGIASAVQAARAKKRYESMTPEEREAHNKRMDGVLAAIFDAYGFDKAKTEAPVEAETESALAEEVTA
ncbi:MAG: hypothetical protein IKL68_03800 [Clostridia bacterium]|nr:hypothetical protein [Clostridia bacterium]